MSEPGALTQTPLLTLDGVCKTYGGVHAVRDVSLEWTGGRLYGLIGPNGAGKSTLVNLITGIARPDSGRIKIRDTDVTGWSPHRVARQGVSRTFQTSILIEDEPVRDNVMVGRHRQLGWRRSLSRSLSGASTVERASRADFHADSVREVLQMLGVGSIIGQRAGDLPYGMRRLVEVARAVVSEADLILLDEPAAGLAHHDAAQLGELLGLLVAGTSRAVVLIEHNVKLVLDSCDEVAVLVEGALAESGTPELVRNSPKVIESYLGSRKGGAGAHA